MPSPVAAEPREETLRYAGWRIALASSACVFVSFASLLVYTFGIFLKPLAYALLTGGWPEFFGSQAI